MFAHALRLRMHHRHRVLQLIAEAPRTTGLVVPAAPEEAASDGLVQQPAIGEHVDCGIGRIHLHRAQRALPIRAHRSQRFLRNRISTLRRPLAAVQALRETGSIASIAAHTKPEDDRALTVDVEIERDLDCSACIQSGAHASRQSLASECGRIAQTAIAADKLDAIAADAALARFAIAVGVEKTDPVGEFRIVGIARKDRAGLGLDLGDQVRLGLRAQIAEYPFDIAGRRNSPWSARQIANPQICELDRCIQRDMNGERAGDAILEMFVDAVTEAMADAVIALASTRQWRWRPHPTAVVVAQVVGFAGDIGDRVAGPRRQSELVRVLAPGITRPAFADDATKLRIRQHVRPWHWRVLAAREPDHVFAAVFAETAATVVELELFIRIVERPVFQSRRRIIRLVAWDRHQRRWHRFRQAASIDLLAQAAIGVADDQARNGLKQHAILLRHLLCRTHKDAARTIDHIGFDARRDQSHDLVLQLLAIPGLVFIPDHQIHRQTFQPPVRVRLHDLSYQFDVFCIGDLQQHDRQIAGNRMSPQSRLTAPILQQHRRSGA